MKNPASLLALSASAFLAVTPVFSKPLPEISCVSETNQSVVVEVTLDDSFSFGGDGTMPPSAMDLHGLFGLKGQYLQLVPFTLGKATDGGSIILIVAMHSFSQSGIEGYIEIPSALYRRPAGMDAKDSEDFEYVGMQGEFPAHMKLARYKQAYSDWQLEEHALTCQAIPAP